ncbi:MAG: hypothetical protein K8823_1613 [Cenarchaeum symbiont of Oopsacas minuta]|nr:hypothetical protein [Cenarchaeum symbiont of Oopsacas minuta]
MKDHNAVIVNKLDNIIETVKRYSLDNAKSFSFDIRSLAFDLELDIELLIGGVLYDRLYDLNKLYDAEIMVHKGTDSAYSDLVGIILEIKKAYAENKELDIYKSLIKFMRITLQLRNNRMLSESNMETSFRLRSRRG